jgi:single-stranded DNA-binding protein
MANSGLNKVFLVGVIDKIEEKEYDRTLILIVTVKTTTEYNDKQTITLAPVTFMGKNAEIYEKSIREGQLVAIEGKIRTNESKTGTVFTQVSGSTLQILSSGNAERSRGRDDDRRDDRRRDDDRDSRRRDDDRRDSRRDDDRGSSRGKGSFDQSQFDDDIPF